VATLGCLAACGAAEPSAAPESATPEPSPVPARVLLAYFSRAGENYYYGDRTYLQVGNTEVLAGMICSEIACDVHRIEAAEPYSDDYEDTVARNVREQQADARPPIANPLPAVDGYDVVLLGSGLWNVRPPMIMRTFAEGLDLSGKTVLPVVTYAVSGIGSAPDVYAQACPGATIGEGIAVRGEEVAQAGPEVAAWLERVGLRQPR
jgi:flavodoxin